MEKILAFIILSFATWRISSFLVNEDGPYDFMAKLRYMIGVRYDNLSVPQGLNVVAKLLCCLWCTSVWVGIVMSLLSYPESIGWFVAKALAFSTAAILIDSKVSHG